MGENRRHRLTSRPAAAGFTLVELIVVIAIIGILAAILIPSLIGYVKKAQLSADSATAKNIYNELTLLLIDDEKEYLGYRGSGDIMETIPHCFNTVNYSTKYNVTFGSDTYSIWVVTKCAGAPPADHQDHSLGYYSWGGIRESKAINTALNEHFLYSRKGEYLIRKQSRTYNNSPTDLWMICYRLVDGQRQPEIWAGDSTGRWASQPRYRLYPDPGPPDSVTW